MEQNVNDPYYIGKLIVICNSAVNNPKILSLLPKHTPRHYRYLRDKFPKFFPIVPAYDQTYEPSDGSVQDEELSNSLSIDVQGLFSSTWKQILELFQQSRDFPLIESKLRGFANYLAQASRVHSHLQVLIKYFTLLHKLFSCILQVRFILKNLFFKLEKYKFFFLTFFLGTDTKITSGNIKFSEENHENFLSVTIRIFWIAQQNCDRIPNGTDFRTFIISCDFLVQSTKFTLIEIISN
jgi:hypothetical protein